MSRKTQRLLNPVPEPKPKVGDIVHIDRCCKAVRDREDKIIVGQIFDVLNDEIKKPVVETWIVVRRHKEEPYLKRLK